MEELKIVSRNVSKNFTEVGKSVSLPKGTTLKKMFHKWTRVKKKAMPWRHMAL
jgi:hypothetical protein